MIRLPLFAFGVTIGDKTFGFPLFQVSTFFLASSFQLFTPKILCLLTFSSQLSFGFPLRSSKFFSAFYTRNSLAFGVQLWAFNQFSSSGTDFRCRSPTFFRSHSHPFNTFTRIAVHRSLHSVHKWGKVCELKHSSIHFAHA